jgi:hypothetical protein
VPCWRSSRRAAVKAASSVSAHSEVTEHRPKRLTRVDRVEELLPHLDGQACSRSGSSPGSLGVALKFAALGAATGCIPSSHGAVSRTSAAPSALGIGQVRAFGSCSCVHGGSGMSPSESQRRITCGDALHMAAA